MGEKPKSDMTVYGLKSLITGSQGYEEEFVETFLETIISAWKEEKQESQSKLQMEMEARKQEMEFELQKKKFDAGMATSDASSAIGGKFPINPQLEISKSMSKFNSTEKNVTSSYTGRDNRDCNGNPKQTKQDKGLTRNKYEPKTRPKLTCYFCGADGHVKKFCPKLSKTNSDKDSRRKANVHRTVVDPELVNKETAVVAKVLSHRRPSLDKAEKYSLVNVPMDIIVGKDGNMIRQELCAVAATWGMEFSHLQK
ncbi:hypothetical protein HNY73_017339 [Argiope bruennichi]|uniref:CCHC-type domain-containing protein n=1 Tax=Argiope bruennichi TaxID=94029 RepID=A0A8T0EQA0_ARGBR|nr:hypothetical protein HNY73_017339 [Argiope bruennichi]